MALFGEKKSFFGRMSERITDVLMARVKVDEELMEELEEILITSDIGMGTTMKIMELLRKEIKDNSISNPEDVKEALTRVVAEICDKGERQKLSSETPLVILVVGINGGGKTTSIAKLGHMFKSQGKTVLFAAADTFRAAAAEQLDMWGKRIGVNTVMHNAGADPSAVIFDSIQSVKAKGIDVLICDTAGRLQTKKNLMAELEKMNKVIDKEFPEAKRETLLVLDATTGKNAVSQAEEFGNVTDVSGIILTKLDGSAKGGIAITVADEFDLPIKFIGVGEKMEDLQVFDGMKFAGGIFQ
ncbi:MAG: signal recognition particle-docking protein FtsY [Peptostreptococcaceae bacterium]|nr:signal recognition particle-docking protein FtsY [Peptostreptococcaceae bacterium]MDY5738893.1 signal recognition particle-docking protein FtsY [Anaerovoracaceae bacterium]